MSTPAQTVTAIILNPNNELLLIKDCDGYFNLPYAPITHYDDSPHLVYTPYEIDCMKSLADMLLNTLGVTVDYMQWRSNGISRTDGTITEEYVVSLTHYPEENPNIKWVGDLL